MGGGSQHPVKDRPQVQPQDKSHFKLKKKKEEEKRDRLENKKIKINLKAEYSPSDPTRCEGTCVGGLTEKTTQGIIALQDGTTTGNIMITGGSETYDRDGNKVHSDAHHKGYKVDIDKNSAGDEAFDDYGHKNKKLSDAEWEDKYGFSRKKLKRFADEKSHYDIKFDQE